MTSEVVVVHAQQEPPEAWDAAVFLAGPTPRDPAVGSWRPAALALLRERWRGPGRLVVFVPESPGGGMTGSWDAQVAWEDRWLDASDMIAFWVPRDLDTLPGFTTNVEWGRWESSGRVVLGAPPGAPGTRYLRHSAARWRAPVADTLVGALDAVLAEVGAGARRTGGARGVPLLVWRTPVFQDWWRALVAAGNTLVSARLLWTHRAHGAVFCWALRVRVHVAAEGRIKDNEVVVARPTAVMVALYRRAATWQDTAVVLVREFRSPGVTRDGYVRELPGGGLTGAPVDPLAQAVAEVAEETGLRLDPGRLRAHGCRQVAATFAAHRAHLFSAELTEPELAGLTAAAGTAHGVAADSERTYPEVTTVGQLLGCTDVDWVTVGALTEALLT